MNNFSKIESFNLYGDSDELEKKIKTYTTVGWVYIGETPIVTAPFVSVGWPKENGEVIYPVGYSKLK